MNDLRLWPKMRLICSLLAFALHASGQEIPVRKPPDSSVPHSGQEQPRQADPTQNGQKHKPSSNHIFWVIPNYRADESTAPFKPLTPGAKFKIALDDSFDPSAFLVAGVFAGINMAQNQYRSFGQGAGGFAKYYGGAFADQAIGNMMTEALFPVVLKQDPRYFTKGGPHFWKRTGYAITREVITRGDDGRNHFNNSELAGNAVAAGVSNCYYPAADRSLSKTTARWGQQIALDTVFNVLKEFWPDVRKKLFGQ